MAYTDKTYFLKKIKQTDLDNLIKDSGGTPQDSYLENAINTADALIDSHLRTVIETLPFSPVPEIIKQLSFNIASFLLNERLQAESIPARVMFNYDYSVKLLEDISRGELDLGLAAESGIWFESGEEEIFGRGSY